MPHSKLCIIPYSVGNGGMAGVNEFHHNVMCGRDLSQSQKEICDDTRGCLWLGRKVVWGSQPANHLTWLKWSTVPAVEPLMKAAV